MENGKAERKKTRTGRRLLFLVLMLLIVIAAAYVYWDNSRFIDRTLQSFRDNSGEAVTTTMVKSALALSRRVSAFSIDVDSENGLVTLTGSVPTREIRDLAEAIAADTPGVLGVDNQLAVISGTRPRPGMESLSERVKDLEARAEIAGLLAGDPLIGALAIEITVKDMNIRLRGTVDSIEQKHRAEQLVLTVEGIRSVANELLVPVSGPEIVPGDEVLSRSVLLALFDTGVFESDSIRVVARDGVVTLHGTVRSEAEKLLAAMIAADTSGVSGVLNETSISSNPPEPGTSESEP